MPTRTLKLGVKPLPLAVVTLALALTCALGGCSDAGPVTDGPLSSGAFGRIPRGANCVTARVGQPQTFGDQLFTNHGHLTVVLDYVALLRPHNERIIGSYVVPGKLIIGVVYWPPNYPGMPSTWKYRKPVHDFRLASGKSFNMVLGVVATASGLARSQGMVVYYHDSSGSYVARNAFAMLIAVTKSGCN